jgi:hypothetical protein
MLTAAMRQLVSFEAEASAIQYFCPVAVPGPLQTRDYSRGIMSQFTHELGDDEIDLRSRRKTALQQRDPRPNIFVLFDESVLLRGSAAPGAFTEQFAEIAKFIDKGWVTARIRPLNNPYPGLGPFEMLYLDPFDEATQCCTARASCSTRSSTNHIGSRSTARSGTECGRRRWMERSPPRGSPPSRVPPTYPQTAGPRANNLRAEARRRCGGLRAGCLPVRNGEKDGRDKHASGVAQK